MYKGTAIVVRHNRYSVDKIATRILYFSEFVASAGFE